MEKLIHAFTCETISFGLENEYIVMYSTTQKGDDRMREWERWIFKWILPKFVRTMHLLQ